MLSIGNSSSGILPCLSQFEGTNQLGQMLPTSVALQGLPDVEGANWP